jgi:hypothetical protein
VGHIYLFDRDMQALALLDGLHQLDAATPPRSPLPQPLAAFRRDGDGQLSPIRPCSDGLRLPPIDVALLLQSGRCLDPPLFVSQSCGATIAAAVLVMRDTRAPAREVVKGGELAIDVVGPDGVARRMAAVEEALRVRVSCGAGQRRGWDVVVFAADGATFPLGGGSLTCGNGLVLPGAFRLDRPGAADVCVALDPAPRASLRSRAALAGDHACAALTVR